MPLFKRSKQPRLKKKRARISRGLRIFSLFLVVAVLGTVGIVAWAFLPADATGKQFLVEIPNHATGRDIAGRLKQKGVIRSEIAFILIARFLGETAHMQPGDYQLSPRMTLAQIITTLTRGDNLAEWVTIPEGYTLRQAADELDDKKLADPRRFERIARAGGQSFTGLSFQPPTSLEGYLFPDTYKIRKQATERSIIETMLKNFDTKAVKPLAPLLKQAEAQGRSMQDIVILASMVEKEAKVKAELPVIAGVLLRRLTIGMRLQCDATVQYALAAPKRRLTNKDLEVPSPYNTYLINGLPPGPICNPGLDALKAALQPKTVKALYYVARPDGTHIFSLTLEQHNAARMKVRRLAKQASKSAT